MKYIAELYAAQAELNKLLEKREQAEIDIAKKRYQIAALLALTEENEEVDQIIGVNLGGLTDAVLAAFRSAAYRPLTPVQVKERLIQLGFPVCDYKNVMAAIHTVVKRLHEAGKIVDASEGEVAYALAKHLAPALPTEVRNRFKSRFSKNRPMRRGNE
jgi:hypothetical protein